MNSLNASSTHFPNKDRLWQTCALDNSGNVVVLKTHESIDESFEWLSAGNVIQSMEQSGISVDRIISGHGGVQPYSASAAISVLGGVLLGYLFGVVVDGVVISATGESTAYWFAQALQNTLQRALSPDRTTRISCSLYLGMGSIYFNCMWGRPSTRGLDEMATFKSAGSIIVGMTIGVTLYIVLDLLSIILVPNLDPVLGLIIRAAIFAVALIALIFVRRRKMSENAGI